MFSRTDSSGKISVIWKVRAIPMATRSVTFIFVTVSPSNTISPAVGSKNPEIMLKNVVLPAPLGPMMARSSRRHLHRHFADGDEAAEFLRDVANIKHDHFEVPRWSMPRRPRGKNRTTKTKIRPTKDIQLTVMDEM